MDRALFESRNCTSALNSPDKHFLVQDGEGILKQVGLDQVENPCFLDQVRPDSHQDRLMQEKSGQITNDLTSVFVLV